MKAIIPNWVAIVLGAIVSLARHLPAQDFSMEPLDERNVHRRAVEAVIWGMPVVNMDLMRHEMLTKTAGKVNQVTYWGRPLDWHNQTLTHVQEMK